MTKDLSQSLFTNKRCSRDNLSAIRHDLVKYEKLYYKIASYCSCQLRITSYTIQQVTFCHYQSIIGRKNKCF
ncbi:hypothetical protein BU183_11835 [Enterococcus faecium]|nr:hypothetical protein BU183_11835 [Enterococcus faecium]